jgi:hypothetical protein
MGRVRQQAQDDAGRLPGAVITGMPEWPVATTPRPLAWTLRPARPPVDLYLPPPAPLVYVVPTTQAASASGNPAQVQSEPRVLTGDELKFLPPGIRPRVYEKNDGIRARRRRYKCPSGCVPSRLALNLPPPGALNRSMQQRG